MSAARKIELAVSKELLEKLAAERELSTRLAWALTQARCALEVAQESSDINVSSVARHALNATSDTAEAFRGARGTHE